MEHAFLLCPWVTPIWFGLQICPVPNATSVSSCTNWLTDLLTNHVPFVTLDPQMVVLLYVTLWFIWIERNEVVFSSAKPNPLGILHRAKAYTVEVMETFTNVPDGPSARVPSAKIVSLWRLPREGVLKINSDASFLKQTGRVFGGYIIPTTLGRW